MSIMLLILYTILGEQTKWYEYWMILLPDGLRRRQNQSKFTKMFNFKMSYWGLERLYQFEEVPEEKEKQPTLLGFRQED